MIKVLHYIGGFNYGGIESLFLSWFEHLDIDKVQFELLMRTQEDSYMLDRYVEQGGVYHRLKKFDIRKPWIFRKSVKEFFRTNNDYDILHAHVVDPYIYNYAKKYGIKTIIVHSHTSGFQSIAERIRYLFEKIDNRIYVDYAMACSKKAAKWKFGGYSYKGNEVMFLKNAIETNKYRFDETKRRKVRDEFNLGDRIVIGHVGRMCYPKNDFYLLDIVNVLRRSMPSVVLLMVGDGPDRTEIGKYIENIKLIDNVILAGKREDVPQLLHCMDAFLLPSRFEGFPLTVLEAEASGLPCIISDRITGEVDVTELVTRLSIDENPQVWANTIERELKNIKDKSRVEYNDIVAESYGVEAETKKLMNIYERCTSAVS